MKSLRIVKLAAAAMTIAMVASCGGSTRKVVNETPYAQTVVQKQEFLQKVSDNAQHARFVTSKVKFSVEVGAQQLTLTGNLKMKRDDVIRLQLMAFGFVEAGRLEFTKDYVLIMDRINKQYLRVPYNQLDFMRNSGLDFYALQALFWNELTMPGTKQLTSKDYRKYDVDLDAAGENLPISLKKGNMTYKWQANKENALISNATVNYVSNSHGSSDLTWDYSDFTKVDVKQFPANQMFKFTTTSTGKKKTVEVNIKMKSVKTTEKWETKTTVSSKYKKVQPENVLGKLLGM